MDSLKKYRSFIDDLTDTDSYSFYVGESGFPDGGESIGNDLMGGDPEFWAKAQKLFGQLNRKQRQTLGLIAEYFVREGIGKCLTELRFSGLLPPEMKAQAKGMNDDFRKRCKVGGQPHGQWENSHG